MTTLSTEQIVAELKWNELAIKEVTGYSPRFFRPVSFLFFLIPSMYSSEIAKI